jgi:hypothetical protein
VLARVVRADGRGWCNASQRSGHEAVGPRHSTHLSGVPMFRPDSENASFDGIHDQRLGVEPSRLGHPSLLAAAAALTGSNSRQIGIQWSRIQEKFRMIFAGKPLESDRRSRARHRQE